MDSGEDGGDANQAHLTFGHLPCAGKLFYLLKPSSTTFEEGILIHGEVGLRGGK
jgi:hypothetical protein